MKQSKTSMDIDYVSKLARLKLDPAERDRFSHQLGDILSYIQKLNELDTQSVEPTQHILPVKNVTRPDVVKPSIDPELVLKHAPESRDNFFIVPQIIE